MRHEDASQCKMRPSVDLAPVQKRLRTYSAQFYDFRLVRAQIAANDGHKLSACTEGWNRRWTPIHEFEGANSNHSKEDEMHKRYEEEQRRIEHADNAIITFTIALHGPHAWEMRTGRWSPLSRHEPRVGHRGSAPWENTIAPML